MWIENLQCVRPKALTFYVFFSLFTFFLTLQRFLRVNTITINLKDKNTSVQKFCVNTQNNKAGKCPQYPWFSHCFIVHTLKLQILFPCIAL